MDHPHWYGMVGSRESGEWLRERSCCCLHPSNARSDAVNCKEICWTVEFSKTLTQMYTRASFSLMHTSGSFSLMYTSGSFSLMYTSGSFSLMYTSGSFKRPKAVVSIQPDKQVFIGETVTLRCDIQGEGVSNWQHSWFKDDSSTPVSNEQQYRISSVTESHSGKYTCRGTERRTSRYSHTSDAVTLTVSEKPKPEITSNHKGAALIRNPVVLYCELDQSAGWKFYWSKHTQNPENEIKTETHSYSISSVSVSDGGQYWCRAGRGDPVYYTHYSDALWIKVTERPKTVVSIQPDKQVFIGETVTLRCDIQGEGVSDWQYSWFKDDSSTPVSKEQQYRISSVTESHRGKYTCRGTERGTSRYSHTSDAVTLTVSALPRATLTVEPESPVFSGESVTLKCEINTHDGWTYQWYKQNKQSRWTAVSQSVYYTVNRETLTIREDAVINGDQYQCRGERRYRPTSSQNSNSVTLTVKALPRATLTVEPKWSPVFTGESVTLKCEIESHSDWRYQ
ncbi:immunoglobulin superfamily member 1-like [Colossoma macropomum]|uniref:immunoglobulin superfamily member 1-like n=1 Tax=Colossoma macropomum TaxID=42526 RepID=UPI0018646D93|nr:immunoglobulin superfamily member 1-like [Colossoma macropomum]